VKRNNHGPPFGSVSDGNSQTHLHEFRRLARSVGQLTNILIDCTAQAATVSQAIGFGVGTQAIFHTNGLSVLVRGCETAAIQHMTGALVEIGLHSRNGQTWQTTDEEAARHVAEATKERLVVARSERVMDLLQGLVVSQFIVQRLRLAHGRSLAHG